MKTPKSVEERFLEKVDKTDTCWLWNASRRGSKQEYGQFRFEGKPRGAHVISYILHKGEVPEGKEVCHTHPGNKHCVNPDHLYVGTHKQNMQDRLRDGNHPMKNKTHCKHGHEFTEENTILYKNSRKCRVCERKRKSACYYKKKGEKK